MGRSWRAEANAVGEMGRASADMVGMLDVVGLGWGWSDGWVFVGGVTWLIDGGFLDRELVRWFLGVSTVAF